MKCLYRNPFIRSFIFQDKEPAGSGSTGGSERYRQIQKVERDLPISVAMNRLGTFIENNRISPEFEYNAARSLVDSLESEGRISGDTAADYRVRLERDPRDHYARQTYETLRAVNEVYSFLDNPDQMPGGVPLVDAETSTRMKNSMRSNPSLAPTYREELRARRAQDLPGNPYQQN